MKESLSRETKEIEENRHTLEGIMKKQYETYLENFGEETPVQEKRSWDLTNIKQKIKIEQQKESQNAKQIVEYEKVISQKKIELNNLRNGKLPEEEPRHLVEDKTSKKKKNIQKNNEIKKIQESKKIKENKQSQESLESAQNLLDKKMKENGPSQITNLINTTKTFIWNQESEQILSDIVYQEVYNFEAVKVEFQKKMGMKISMSAEEMRIKFSEIYSKGGRAEAKDNALKQIVTNRGDTFQNMKTGKVQPGYEDFDELD